jgi:hypothetical protein
MRTPRFLTGLGLALLVAALALVPALADGSVEVVAGALSATDTDVALGSYPFSFSETQTSTVTVPVGSEWTVSDLRGVTTGWHINMVCSSFANGGSTFAVTATNQRLRGSLPGANISNTGGSSSPAAQSGMPGYGYCDPTAPVKLIFMNAPSGGPSTWAYRPNWDLRIPAAQLAGAYVSVWTLSALDGPS